MAVPGGLMRRRRVLVIEDDRTFQDLLTEVLHEAGYDVTATDSVLGTAKLVRRQRPDVILLDLGLPFRSGASLLTELKADPRTADIPILVVSGSADALTPERRALATAVIAKPVEIDALVAAVGAACASPP